MSGAGGGALAGAAGSKGAMQRASDWESSSEAEAEVAQFHGDAAALTTELDDSSEFTA